MPEYLAPGVYVEEVLFRERTVTGTTTYTATFVGEAEKVPLDEVRANTSYAEFEKYYGKPLRDRYLAQSVQLFFKNGGKRPYIELKN